jgi:hypothetical protein
MRCSTASFPTFPIPGNPSIKIGFLSFGDLSTYFISTNFIVSVHPYLFFLTLDGTSHNDPVGKIGQVYWKLFFLYIDDKSDEWCTGDN